MSLKIVVPEGMLDYANEHVEAAQCASDEELLIPFLEAALRWLSENPVVPNQKQAEELLMIAADAAPLTSVTIAVEWQRRMFDAAPEPEIPEEVKDLLKQVESDQAEFVIEAFNRGRRLGEREP